VAKANQEISFGPLQDRVAGSEPFELHASSSSGLPVSFNIVSGPATVLGNVVTITGVGPVTVRAVQSGNQNYHPASDVDRSFNVSKAEQTISFAPLANRTFGEAAFQVTATASSGLPVSFAIVSGPATIAGNVITITGAGTVTVRASQGGNDAYHPAPNVDRSFEVAKASQSIAFSDLPDRTYGDQPFSLSATASSGLPVSFNIVSGPATLSGDTLTITGAGHITVRATQAGNANYNPAQNVDLSFDVQKANQTLTFGSIANRTYGDQPFTPNASASSGLPVTFAVISGPATIVNNQVNINGIGTVVVRATQSGNSNYNPAPSSDQTFSVSRASLVVTAANVSRLEGTANPTLIGTISGLRNGDNITASYSTTATASSSAGTYPITITLHDPNNRLGNYNVSTVNGTLTVQLRAPTVISQPSTIKTNQGANLVLSVETSGNEVLYQWRKNGNSIPGATSSSLSLSNAQVQDSGTYDLLVSNDAGWVVSDALSVSIFFVPLDLDQNGTAEILFQNADDRRLAAWYMDGATFQQGAVLRNGKPLGEGWRLAGQNDFNGDSQTDFIFQHNDGRMAAWLMNGANLVNSVTLENVAREPLKWRIVGTGDFDGNGSTDLLLMNTERKLAIRFMDGTTGTGGAWVRDGVVLPEGWRVVGARDFNQDGSMDILFQHTDGRLVVWLMNGIQYVQPVSLRSPAPNSGWKVVGLGDFTKDGHTDLLWRHIDGRVAVWRMENTNFVQSMLLRNGSTGNPAWFIIGPK
ncbi:MAG: FG-GAP-like repeat-containing protein, partial [Limisphaerales bacterium]